MAWRIEDSVVRGEIDNRTPGVTSGRVWLLGRADPLVLVLDGDCWRDLAGSSLHFTNPLPLSSSDAQEIADDQTGLVGDMTASRKCRMLSVSEQEAERLIEEDRDVPHEWKNLLYLEWFSHINGRVIIESADYQLQVSEHEWMMDEDAEAAQKLANLNAMRDFMAQVIQRRESSDEETAFSGEMDEFAWEERLKESDRLTDAYQEVLEKYIDDPESERKEAFVMGWDGLLDAMADRDETSDGFGDLGEEEDSFEDEEFFLSMDEPDDSDDHPLQVKARELALLAMDLVQRDSEMDNPGGRIVSCLLQVSGKLAATLNGRNSGYEPETGYILAILKRCLNWLNEAVGACQELMVTENDPDHKAALMNIRNISFEIRDAITELRRELKS